MEKQDIIAHYTASNDMERQYRSLPDPIRPYVQRPFYDAVGNPLSLTDRNKRDADLPDAIREYI